MRKSQFAGLLLTFLFGPIGLFYSSIAAGIGFCIFAAVLALTSGFLALIVWPVAMIVGGYLVARHNDKIHLEEQRHQELLDAMGRDDEEAR
ncbi:MAG: hypothetical protein OXI22_07300 [Defluviicoccus sp.]|nr:hypothetical protein [Defluviicoccus sp.]MDE0383670.1 hypothetical protein [Defluviicoccus sp.]